jgi:hypothetical protein
VTDSPSPTAPDRRVGVIVAGPLVPAYQATLLRQLGTTLGLDIAYVGVASEGGRARPRWRRLVDGYRRLERRLLERGDDALTPVSLDSLAGLPTPASVVASNGGLSAESERIIAAAELDVILDLRRRPDPPLPTSLARLGVWRLVVEGARPGSSIEDAVREGAAVTRSSVVAWSSERPVSIVLESTYSPVVAHSLDRTLQAAHRAASRVAVRALARLAQGDDAGPGPSRAVTSVGVDQSTADRGEPGAVAALGLVVRLATRLARRGIHRLTFRGGWFVAFRWTERADPLPRSVAGFTPITAPTGRFYADPFVVETDGVHHVFVEDYDRSLGRARITTFQLGRDGPLTAPVSALERPYHLSYPYVFYEAGAYHMTPETRGNDRIELYRAVRFPDRWEPEAVLVEGISAADPTILRVDDRLWLFVTVAEPGRDAWEDLFVFSARSLEGPWVPHPRNPVVSDVRSARPAGRPFLRDGAIIRPAQDCSREYGWRIAWRRIDVLSPTDYAETTIGHVDPVGAPGLTRTHCYDAAGSVQVLDGYRSVARVRRRPS